MRNKTCLSVAVLVLALWPTIASASDMTGLLTLMTLAFVVAPLTLVHIVVMLVLATRGTYRTKTAAWRHALIASIAPVLGMTVAVLELNGARHAQDLAIVLSILLGVLAVSLLPMAIHQFQKPAGARKYRHSGND